MLRRFKAPIILTLLGVTAIALTACNLDSDSSPPPTGAAKAAAATVGAEPTAAPVQSVSETNQPVAQGPAPTAAPTPTQAPEPTSTSEPAPTASPTEAPAPTAAAQPTQVPEPTAAPEPTIEPIPTQAPETTPTDTPMVIEGTGNDGIVGAAPVSLTPSQELPTTEVVKILTPSVAHIATELATTGGFNSALPPSGVGTGVILSTDGLILTNNHVIEGAQLITVTLHDGRNVPARIVGTDATTDLAVIQISAEGLEPAMLGNSSELLVGQDVIAIGHALGLSGAPTVSKGVVSALERSIDSESGVTIVDLIQTDASINPGNSGGPLVNTAAEVIGINTAIIRGGQGIGFAINIDDAKIVARQLIDNGFVRRGYLGVFPVGLTPARNAQLGFPTDTVGIYLNQVNPNTAADAAGLQSGDIILMMGGQALRNNGELSKFLISHQPGDTVDLVILRNGRELTGQITLGERPDVP